VACSKYVIVNILHKGDNKKEEEDNDNTDDDNNVMLYRGDAIFCRFITRDSGSPLCEINPPPPPKSRVNGDYGYVVLRTDTWEI